MTLDELISEVRADGSTSLEHLASACTIANHLSDLSDHLVGHFVDQARRDGASWTMIGQAMGVTKQAVQKRFTAGDPDLARFTNRATVVVLKGQNDARERGHDEVGTLHLLLGVTAEWEGLAGQAIQAAGVTRNDLVRRWRQLCRPVVSHVGSMRRSLRRRRRPWRSRGANRPGADSITSAPSTCCLRCSTSRTMRPRSSSSSWASARRTSTPGSPRPSQRSPVVEPVETPQFAGEPVEPRSSLVEPVEPRSSLVEPVETTPP